MYKPLARSEKLTVRQLPDETLVYDHQTNKGHCLNATAALVWKHCDGMATVAELARRIGQPAAVVELALEQLSRRGLLAKPAPALAGPARLARRNVLKKLAFAAALPLVLTITSRAAAQIGESGGICACTCFYDSDGNFSPPISYGFCKRGTCSCKACPATGPKDGNTVLPGHCPGAGER